MTHVQQLLVVIVVGFTTQSCLDVYNICQFLDVYPAYSARLKSWRVFRSNLCVKIKSELKVARAFMIDEKAGQQCK